MHPEVVSEEPGRCPMCGMKLLPDQLVVQAAGHGTHAHHDGANRPAHHEGHKPASHGGGDAHTAHHHGHGDHEQRGHGHHAAHGQPREHTQHGQDEHRAHHGPGDHQATGGIEWEDDMVAVNRMTTPANTRWLLVDRATGAVNHAIDWRFRVGDKIKLRLVNETDSDHPMHHPFHVHGAGRFVVLARDGVSEANLVWKDTMLVRTGETVDILLDITNPGVWMAHCHIAEHHESGMMFSFRVDE
jgi:FtsP/CotA-like multicopper oxidase with cupredoxin domain